MTILSLLFFLGCGDPGPQFDGRPNCAIAVGRRTTAKNFERAAQCIVRPSSTATKDGTQAPPEWKADVLGGVKHRRDLGCLTIAYAASKVHRRPKRRPAPPGPVTALRPSSAILMGWAPSRVCGLEPAFMESGRACRPTRPAPLASFRGQRTDLQTRRSLPKPSALQEGRRRWCAKNLHMVNARNKN